MPFFVVSLNVDGHKLTLTIRYQIHCSLPDGSVKLSLSLLMQLAISLVFDLQLNKKEIIPPVHNALGFETHKVLDIAKCRTVEAKRAGLSVFLLTSM